MSVFASTSVGDLIAFLSFRNQSEFAELSARTLDCLAKFGRLGPVELLMFYAFRNKAGDVVAYQ